MIPTAALLGLATEDLASRSGPGIGGLLNVTFGNVPELVIAGFALAAGLHEVVKASLVGSVLGNVLLVMGGTMLVGGRFDRTSANVQSLMLLLASVALVMPALFELVAVCRTAIAGRPGCRLPRSLACMSAGAAVVILARYCAGLIFSLGTHRDLYNPFEGEDYVVCW